MKRNSSEDGLATAVGSTGADATAPADQPPRSRVDRAREQEVLAHVRAGRRELALKILMVVYGDLLAALFARLVPDRARVKDIYQDVFLQVFRGIPKVERRDNSSLWSWLCRISYHRLVDEQRRQRRSDGAMDLPDLDGFDQILAAPESLPVIRVDDSWHDGVFEAAARLERRSARRRWALAGGAVAVVAAAAMVVVAVTRPAPPPELEVVIRHNVATRGDSKQASVGDLLVVVARPSGTGDLRVYRGRDVLVARCPSGPDCAAPAEGGGEQIIQITLEAPVRYEVVLVVGAGIELPRTSLDAYLEAARAVNARIEIRSIVVH